ncbi:MAG: hypothetical protein MJ212_05445 [Alphaproteobacteria bacterium]|nr:hypothetical protein [Alphaproteobacteria bacterium]
MKHGGEFEEIGSVDQYVATGLLPEEICDKNYVDIFGGTGESCQLPVGEIDMVIGSGGSSPIVGGYSIYFTDGNKERNCVDFLSYHWEKITPKEWWNPNERDGTGGRIDVYSPWKTIYAGKKQAERLHAPTELTMDNIAQACHEACKGDYCYVEMVFRDEW